MSAFMFLATKRRDQEQYAQFALMWLKDAEKKVIDKQVARWEKDA